MTFVLGSMTLPFLSGVQLAPLGSKVRLWLDLTRMLITAEMHSSPGLMRSEVHCCADMIRLAYDDGTDLTTPEIAVHPTSGDAVHAL
jgi:hypothetical protein